MTFTHKDRVVIAAPTTPYALNFQGQAGTISNIVPNEPYPYEVTLDSGKVLGFADYELESENGPSAFQGVSSNLIIVDEINNPPHYTWLPNGIEVIDITEHLMNNLGNVVKYVLRANHKHDDPLTDLRKAAFYIEREIARLEAAK